MLGFVRSPLNVDCVGSYYSNFMLIFSICFMCNPYSLVLILHIPVYLGIKGDHFFSDHDFLSVVLLCTNQCTTICITCPILREIECNEFVCNKFVLVY